MTRTRNVCRYRVRSTDVLLYKQNSKLCSTYNVVASRSTWFDDLCGVKKKIIFYLTFSSVSSHIYSAAYCGYTASDYKT
jgi:hypothetical protein